MQPSRVVVKQAHDAVRDAIDIVATEQAATTPGSPCAPTVVVTRGKPLLQRFDDLAFHPGTITQRYNRDPRMR